MHGVRRDTRCAALPSDTMRMATRKFSNRQDALVLRLALTKEAHAPDAVLAQAGACSGTSPNMHGVRRDARCAALPSDTMRMATHQFSNRQDAMVMRLALTNEAHAPDAVLAQAGACSGTTQHAWRPTRCALRGAAVRHHAHGGAQVLQSTGRAGDALGSRQRRARPTLFWRKRVPAAARAQTCMASDEMRVAWRCRPTPCAWRHARPPDDRTQW